MGKKPLVSIIIPTKNSSKFLENCLKSIRKQTYPYIETIIVDGKSTDETIPLAKKYNVTLYIYKPKVASGIFDAPHKKNYGAKKAEGAYIYLVDADMELQKDVVKEAVSLCEEGSDAVIIPENSFGRGIWAQAKNLERRCYWGDDTIESPRFVKKKVWNIIGGFDQTLGGGGEDWDLYQKLQEGCYKTVRTTNLVRHNEGDLHLTYLMRKRFMYGRDTLKYIAKRPSAGMKSYFPIRKAYIKNWRLFLKRPNDTLWFLIMRTAEYGSGLAGILYSFLKKEASLKR